MLLCAHTPKQVQEFACNSRHGVQSGLRSGQLTVNLSFHASITPAWLQYGISPWRSRQAPPASIGNSGFTMCINEPDKLSAQAMALCAWSTVCNLDVQSVLRCMCAVRSPLRARAGKLAPWLPLKLGNALINIDTYALGAR